MANPADALTVDSLDQDGAARPFGFCGGYYDETGVGFYITTGAGYFEIRLPVPLASDETPQASTSIIQKG